MNILIGLEPDEPITLVTFSESVVLFPFMLEDPLSQVSCDTDIKRMATARDDVREIGPFGHRQDRTRRAVHWQ